MLSGRPIPIPIRESRSIVASVLESVAPLAASRVGLSAARQARPEVCVDHSSSPELQGIGGHALYPRRLGLLGRSLSPRQTHPAASVRLPWETPTNTPRDR